ncbi:MAG: DUF2278 family protein [Candidatus Chlorobium antarcticum]|jgi:hypothetical protein|nr:DUF2278 family protein [Candidatus Chlorobium antarcticum]
MPLDDGYGVLSGTLESWYCDHDGSDRKYYHCNMRVKAHGGHYRCPVDLDSKHLADGLQWRVVDPVLSLPSSLHHLADGWHFLDARPGSGALDYYRSPELQPSGECVAAALFASEDALSDPLEGCPPWKSGSGTEAFGDLERLLLQCERIMVFGEPFRTGRGVHNIHQNQGDPPRSRWRAENGPWQDGAVLVERRDGSIAAFLCKFKTQHFFPPV